MGDQHLPETLPVGLPSTLLERRPDMRQAELTLQAANARVGIAKANMFPRITLTGDLGFESNEVSTLLKSGAWNVIGGLTQPLVGLAKNRANLKAAQARYEQEVLQYQKSVLGAFKEVNNAIVTVRKVKEVRASMENSSRRPATIWNWHSCNTSTVSRAIWMCSTPNVVCWMPRSDSTMPFLTSCSPLSPSIRLLEEAMARAIRPTRTNPKAKP